MRHKFSISILISLISLIIIPALHADDNRYTQLLGEADELVSKGKWAEAEQAYREAILIDPDNPTNVLLQCNIGMLRYYDGRPEEALEVLNAVHTKCPASVMVLMNRAKVYTSLGMITEARTDYTRVCALDSTLAEPHYYLSIMALQRADTTEASMQCDTIRHLAPDSYYHHMARATLHLANGQVIEAVPHLTKVIELDPDAVHYATRALAYLILDDLSSAADDIASGLTLDPTNGELYLYRALLNKRRYRPDDARADAEKAILYGIPAERVKAFMQ